MTSLPTLAIAGATGHLGYHVTKSILMPEFKARFKEVFILSRSDSDKAQELVRAGAKLRLYSEEDLPSALDGVDVLVNTYVYIHLFPFFSGLRQSVCRVGSTGHAFKDKLLRAIPGSSVKVYFPSEFGVNHYVHDFSAKEWNLKKHHFELAKQLLNPDVKISRVYAGLFLEDSIGPWFGFNTKQGKYEAVGDANARTSYTALSDVGRALAVLASLPLESVPSEVHISGTNQSFNEIAQIMQSRGAGVIKVTTVPLEPYKASVIKEGSDHLDRYMRFLMGEGKIDHSAKGLGSSNEFINPEQKYWKWKNMEDLAVETHGKPWKDYD